MSGVKTNTGTYCGHQMPTPNSETEELPHTLGGPEISVDIGATELRAEIRALLEALEKIIAEVSERRVGHREKIAEIARTALARGD